MSMFELIKTASEQKEITIQELEKLAGISNGSVRKWGKSKPSAESLYRIAKVLKLPMEYFLTEGNICLQQDMDNGEQELLSNYRKLDSRGQHRLHTVMYEQVDRVTAAGGTVAETAAAPPQKAKLPANYPVDEYGDPLVPWAASGWADITPKNAEKLQQKLQEFERKSRAQKELEAAKNAAVLKEVLKMK